MGGLVIVESPTKCEKIRKILGQGFEVISSYGHIMDLEKKKLGIDIDTWTPRYVVNPDKDNAVKKIKEAAKNHQNIYVASDADMEGHCISFHVKEILPKKDKNIYRVIFKTITKTDVLAGIKNPIPFDLLAYQAQQTRRMADRVIGFKVSPLMWGKGLKNTSAGRVQSAALKFVVDREREIRAFKEEEYWDLIAKMGLKFDAAFYGLNGKKITPGSKSEVDQIIAEMGKNLIVKDYQNKTREREPSAPFITSSLQKEAGTKFGWSAQKVMDTAQQLFHMGLITYLRTDSPATEPAKLQELRDEIKQQYGTQYLSSQPIIYAAKDNSQGAHECIRPTGEAIPITISTDEQKLFDLIKAKFVSSQMAPAKFDQVQVKLENDEKKKYEFRAAGSILKFDGFLKVYGSSTKDVLLPNLTKGQTIKISKLAPSQHFTKPPPRYTEPAFTEKMEKDGIGRPATYATTIERLIDHKYLIRESKALKPTEVGMMVCQYLERYFPDLTSPDLTAKMENEIDQIALGKLQLTDALNIFYQDLVKIMEAAQKDKGRDLFKTEHDCPKCQDGSKMIKKISEKGIFLGCENYPTCGEILNIGEDGAFVRNKTETGLPCPECGAKVLEKTSKFGKFLACSAYPSCKWTGKLSASGEIQEKKKVEKTDIKCSKCKKGMMVKREGKKGFFLGCDQYPKCKNLMNLDENGNAVEKFEKKPTKSAKSLGKVCPKCQTHDLVERTNRSSGQTFIACSGYPECKYIQK